MKAKKNPVDEISMIPGQMSVWDLEYIKVPEKASINTKEPLISVKSKILAAELKEVSLIQHKIIDKYITDPKLNRLIHYCGDGIGIELKDGENYKTIYVNGKGVEEFSYLKKSSVIYLDKVIWDKEQQELQEEPLDIRSIKVGDYVEAYYGKKIIQGEIVHVYGLDNWILNISFDNHTKQTAIGRQAVRKLLKAA